MIVGPRSERSGAPLTAEAQRPRGAGLGRGQTRGAAGQSWPRRRDDVRIYTHGYMFYPYKYGTYRLYDTPPAAERRRTPGGSVTALRGPRGAPGVPVPAGSSDARGCHDGEGGTHARRAPGADADLV